MVVIFSIF